MSGNVGTGTYELRIDDSRFKKGMADAERQGEGLGKKLGTVGKVAGVAFAGAGVAAAGFAAVSVKEFIGFEKQMNEVFTLLPNVSEDAMKDMTGQVKDFSKEFGVLPDKTVPALYQALSAGVPKDNVFEFLETAQKAAVGGVTDLTTSVDAISTVVNAFGADTISAAEASDLMFTTVRLGKTTFDELGGAISNVAPIAASLGVDFGDVTASLAALTAQGVPTSVATTQVRAALVELGKEGTEVQKTFTEVTGKTFQDFIAGGGNLQTALQALETHASDTGVSMIDLFGSVEAGQAALALTGKGTDAFTTAMGEMQNSAGATDAAFEQMEGGLNRALDKIRARFAVLRLEIGSRLAPAFASFLGFITDRGIPGIESLAGILSGPLSAAFTFIRDGVLTFAAALSGDWTNAEGIRPFHSILGQIGTVIREAVLPGIQALTDLFQGDFGGALEGVGEVMKQTFLGALELYGGLGEAILKRLRAVDWGGVASSIGGGITGALSGLGSAGLSLVTAIADALTNADWSGMAATLVDGLLGGVQAVADFGSRMLGWMSNAFMSVDWTGLGTTIVNGIVTGVTAVADFGSRILTWLNNTFATIDFTAIGQTIVSGLSTALTGAGEGISFVGNWLNTQAQNSDFAPAATSIQNGLSAALATIQTEGEPLLNRILGTGEQVAPFLTETIMPALSTLGELLSTRVTPTIQTFRDSLSQISTSIGPQLVPILQSLQQSWRSLQPAIAPIVTVLGVVAAVIGGVLFTALNTLLNVIGATLPSSIRVAVGAITVLAGVIELITNSVSSIVQIVVGLLTGDWAMAWEGAKQLVTGTAEAIGTIIGGLSEIVLGAIEGLVNGVVAFFEGLYNSLVGDSAIVPNMVNGIITWFTELPTTVFSIVTGFVSDAIDTFTGFAGDVITSVSGMVGDVLGFFLDLKTEAVETASNLATDVLGKFTGLAGDAITSVSGMVFDVLGFYDDLLADAPGLIGDMAGDVLDFFEGLAIDVFEEVKGMVGDVISELEGLPGAAVSAVGNLSGTLYQAGVDLIQGFIDGITSIDIGGIVGGIGQSAVDALNPFGDSPWPAMEEHGRDAMTGFRIGLEDEGQRVLQSLDHFGHDMVSAMGPISDASIAGGGVRLPSLANEGFMLKDAPILAHKGELVARPESIIKAIAASLVGTTGTAVTGDLESTMKFVRNILEALGVSGPSEVLGGTGRARNFANPVQQAWYEAGRAGHVWQHRIGGQDITDWALGRSPDSYLHLDKNAPSDEIWRILTKRMMIFTWLYGGGTSLKAGATKLQNTWGSPNTVQWAQKKWFPKPAGFNLKPVFDEINRNQDIAFDYQPSAALKSRSLGMTPGGLGFSMPRLEDGGVMLRDAPIFAHRGEIVGQPSLIEDAFEDRGSEPLPPIIINSTAMNPHELREELRFLLRTIGLDEVE